MSPSQRKARGRKKPLPTGVATVREVRQIVPTGTVADVAALMPPRPNTDDIVLGIPEEVTTEFKDRTVEAAIAFIDKAGFVGFVDDAYAAMKVKKGRKALLSTRAVMVGMQLAVRDDRPLLLTEIRTILFSRISPRMQRILDIPDDPRPTGQVELRMWKERTAVLVRRAFHRMLAPIDPSVMPKNRIISADDALPLKKALSMEEQQARVVALDWVCNQIVEAAYLQLPQRVRDRHQAKTPGYAIDGTPLPLFAHGRKLDGNVLSTDADGGWYVREGDHADPNETPKGSRGKFKRTNSKHIWARDIHLVVTADASHPTRLYMPGGLPLALTSDVPGRDPAGAARRLFANLRERGHQPGPLAGDVLYTDQDPDKFQTPARSEGYDLVLGYGSEQEGVQGAHSSGALLLEGTYVAPCIPDDLKDATTRLRNGDITTAEYKAFIKARVEYKMRTKATADPAKGIKERLTCPAGGPNPTAMCALKPKSMNPRPTRQPDGAVVDLRRHINHRKVLTDGHAPKVCSQESITLTEDDGAKYRQSRMFGSDDHTSIYYRLRSSQEGVHGSAKAEAGVALANAGRRRVRGWAAQQLFAALLFAETATRRIHTWLTNAKEDRNGDLYVDRLLYADTDTTSPGGGTTGSPPGAAPPPLPGDDTEAA